MLKNPLSWLKSPSVTAADYREHKTEYHRWFLVVGQALGLRERLCFEDLGKVTGSI